MNVRSYWLQVHLEVPVVHVLSVIVAFLDVSTLPLLKLFLDIEGVARIVARDSLLELIAVLEAHGVEVDVVF